jgi:hypothetical protein
MITLPEVLRQIWAYALHARKERRAHKKQLRAVKQQQLAEKRRLRAEKKRQHKRSNALRRSKAVGTMTIDLGKTIHHLWFRQTPLGQGRNAKQRRAQRKARHDKRTDRHTR